MDSLRFHHLQGRVESAPRPQSDQRCEKCFFSPFFTSKTHLVQDQNGVLGGFGRTPNQSKPTRLYRAMFYIHLVWITASESLVQILTFMVHSGKPPDFVERDGHVAMSNPDLKVSWRENQLGLSLCWLKLIATQNLFFGGDLIEALKHSRHPSAQSACLLEWEGIWPRNILLTVYAIGFDAVCIHSQPSQKPAL